jgi:phosphatidate cytidylyltransferase
MSSLLQRVITAIVLALAVLGVLLGLPPTAAGLVVAAFLLLAGWEWSAFVAPRSTAGRVAYTAAIGLGLMLMALAPPTPALLQALLVAGLVWWLLAFVWILRFPAPIAPVVVVVAGACCLWPAFAAFRALLGLAPAGAGEPRGAALAVLVLAIVAAADVGAYFVGRRLGRTRLAPAVSPGKTWEGVGGGLLAALAVTVAGAALLGLPLPLLVPVGISVAAISVVGDLAESMFKRQAGLKDSGALFPGHGGVLDRVDSLAAAIPLFVLEFQWLGLITL